MTTRPLIQTDFPGLTLFNRGKVRDIYDLKDSLLIVATDRISAFDVVLPNGIPDKGKILTTLSLFWFDFTKDLAPNHLITANPAEYPEATRPYAEVLAGRSMLVKKARVIPVECVARGYLAGSGWKDYQKTGSICGIPLPKGLQESSQLPEPIFTPATKAELGDHDENISDERGIEIAGEETYRELKQMTLSVYRAAADYARSRGVIIADTKFEFGRHNGGIILIDEVLTPDSSRFWSVADYQPGRSQDSFDKQGVRDYLEALDWDKSPPAPELPPEVVSKTREKYLEAYRLLTGKTLDL